MSKELGGDQVVGEKNRGLLEELKIGKRTDFHSVNKSRIYREIGIQAAAQVDDIRFADLKGAEANQLRRLVKELARSQLPILYPSDERYLAQFEGLRHQGRVQLLREKLGYFHYFTRSSMLGRLRSSLFSDVLSTFSGHREALMSDVEMAVSLLKYLAAHVDRYSAKVTDVLTYSIHDDLAEDEIDRLTGRVIRFIFGMFLKEPEAYLEAPSATTYWRRYVWEDDFTGTAEETLRSLPKNLGTLFRWWELTLIEEQIPRELEVAYQLLIESRWYRYFFHDERGLKRYMTHGSTGFQDIEVFDDFIEKLHLLDTWKFVVLPDGVSEDDATRVEAARQLGTYRVQLDNDSAIGVEVTPIAGLTIDEIRNRIDSEDLDLSPRVRLFTSSDPVDSYLLRRQGESHLDTGPFFVLNGRFLAFLRLPKPGRYEVIDPATMKTLGSIERLEAYRRAPLILPDVEDGRLRVSQTLEMSLPSPPGKSDLRARVEAPYPPEKVESKSRLIDSESGVYAIDFVAEWKIEPALYGARISVTFPLIDDPLVFEVPEEILVLQEGGILLQPEHETVLEGGRTIEVDTAGTVPLEWRFSQGERYSLSPGSAGQTEGSFGVLEWVTLGRDRSRVILRPSGKLFRSFVIRGRHSYRIRVRSSLQLSFDTPFQSHHGRIHVAALGPDLRFTILDRYASSKSGTVRIEDPDGMERELSVELGKMVRAPVHQDSPGRYLYTVEVPGQPPEVFIVHHIDHPTLRLPPFLEENRLATIEVESSVDLILETLDADGCEVGASPRLGLPSRRLLIFVELLEGQGDHADIRLALRVADSRAAGKVELRYRLPVVRTHFQLANTEVLDDFVGNYAGEPLRVLVETSLTDAEFWAHVDGSAHEIDVGDPTGTELPIPTIGADPIQIRISVTHDGRETRLKSSLVLNKGLVPRMSLNEGLWYVPGHPSPVLLSPPVPDLALRLTVDGSETEIPVAKNGLGWLSGPAGGCRLEVTRGRRELLRFLLGEVRASIALRDLDPDEALPAIYAPNASGFWTPLERFETDSPASIASATLEQMETFDVLGIYHPSFETRVQILRVLVKRGVEILATRGARAPFQFGARDIQIGNFQNFTVSEEYPSIRAVAIDAEAAPRTLPLLAQAKSRWIAILNNAVLGYPHVRDLLIERIAEAIASGDLTSTGDLDGITEHLHPSERLALDLHGTAGELHDLIAKGVSRLVSDKEILRDSQACTSIGLVLQDTNLAPAFSEASSLEIAGQISRTLGELIDVPEKRIEEYLPGALIILDSPSGASLGASVHRLIERDVFGRIAAAKRAKDWGAAFRGYQRLQALFHGDIRYLVDEAALHYERGAWTEDGKHRREMVRKIKQARKLQEDLRSLMGRYPDIYVDRLLSKQFHDCGYIVWVTRDTCPRCGQPFET